MEPQPLACWGTPIWAQKPITIIGELPKKLELTHGTWELAFEKFPVPANIRSFHINDLDHQCIDACGTRDWMGAYDPNAIGDSIEHIKNKHKWLEPADSQELFTQGNMRKWLNILRMRSKSVDLVTIKCDVMGNIVPAIIFAVISECHSAYIQLPEYEQTAAICACVGLFTTHFTRAYVHGSILIGIGGGSCGRRQSDRLYAFMGAGMDKIPFTYEYFKENAK